MKKLTFILILLIPLIVCGQRAFKKGIQVGDSTAGSNIRTQDSITSKYEGAYTFYSPGRDSVLLRQSSAFNVKDYGAIGDGVIDDTEAIQAAIDVCDDNGGGTVFLPVGTYKISSALIPCDYLTLLGGGQRSTILKPSTNNFNLIELNGADFLRISSMRLDGDGKTGVNGIVIDGENIVSELYIESVNFFLLHNGIKETTILVGATIARCFFSYNAAESFMLDDGAQPSNVAFIECHFEETDSCHYRAVGSGGSNSGFAFYKCVFESSHAVKAVDLGNNAKAYLFSGCHFEDNGIDVTNSSACDIFLGTGSKSVNITSCNFSLLHEDGGSGIYIWPGASANIIGNVFTSVKTDYVAINAAGSSTEQMILMGNSYPGNCVAGYINAGVRTTSINDGGAAPTALGTIIDGIHPILNTTDENPISLWEWKYVTSTALFYVIADVLAVSSDGVITCAYTRKALLKHSTGGTVSVVGTDTPTTIESDAVLDCEITIVTGDDSNGVIQLLVTGKAATTIKWSASIKLLYKTWLD